MRVVPLLLLIAAVLPGTAASAAASRLDSVLASAPGDSLAAPLRALESRSAGPEAAEAAMALGRLHLTRAEYREAVAAFGRAAARLDPARKPEARYWLGIAWLGLGMATQARAALEEAVREPSPWRADALLALARTWEMSRRPERALEAIEAALREPPGACAPALIERHAALSEAAGRHEAAERTRERLLMEYPRSIEAAAARRARLAVAEAGGGPVAVVIGTFIDPARARSLAAAAERAGFSGVRVVTKGEGLAGVHSVRLGTYPDRGRAIAAGRQAERALGVTFEVTRAR